MQSTFSKQLRDLQKKHADQRADSSSDFDQDLYSSQSISWQKRIQDFLQYWQSLQGKKALRRRVLPLIGIAVVLIGALATYLMMFTNFDLRQWAWGGALFSSEQLARTSSGIGGDDVSLGDPEIAELFTDLTYLYPEADVLNVADEEYGVSIIAAKAFDPDLGQTLVFIRVENAPYITGTIPKIWLETEMGDLIEAGVGEYVIEQGKLVAYYLTSVEGDGDVYQSLSLTFDEFLDQTSPSPAYFKANFDDEDIEVNL